MNNTFKTYCTLIAAGSVMLTSCSGDMFDGYEDKARQEYEDNWVKKFGDIDPKQDWSCVTSVTARVGVDGNVKVYTAMPGSADAKLLANYDNAETFSFDALKGMKRAYVVATDIKGNTIIRDYIAIVDGQMNITASRSATSRAGSCPVTIGERISDDVMGYTHGAWELKPAGGDRNNGWLSNLVDYNSWNDPQYFYFETDQPYVFKLLKREKVNGGINWTDELLDMYHWQKIYDVGASFCYEKDGGYFFPYAYTPAHYEWNEWAQKPYTETYYLNGVEKTTGSSWMIKDVYDIVGKGGVFHERELDDGICNLADWYDKLNAERGAEYVLAETGPVEFDFSYGGTEKNNNLGYYYYTDADKDDIAAIMARPRYILCDARPHSNITANGTPLTAGMQAPALVEDYNRALDSYDTYHEDPFFNDERDATGGIVLQGSHYKLAYFGPDGKGAASYDFPAGTHVAFFLIKQDNNGLGYSIRHSLPKINAAELKPWTEEHVHDYSYPEGTGLLSAVTYQWGSQIILGFEDGGGDDDMNDLLMFVKGNFTNTPDIPEIGTTPEKNSWIIAAEDLGSTDDYDFNDVVLKVSHVAGETTAVVTPLAAGGSAASDIWFGDESLGEIHSLFGKSGTSGQLPMLNTGYANAKGTPKTITVPADFSVSYGNCTFHMVTNNNSHSVVISNPTTGEAPQVIIVPDTWKWPTERTKIEDAYPLFEKWSQDAGTNTEWYNTYNSDKVCK